MGFNPATLRWEEDEPGFDPSQPPPIAPPPVFEIGGGGTMHGTTPPPQAPPPPAPALPTPMPAPPPPAAESPQQPGILQALAVTQKTRGSSGKVRTQEVKAAEKQQDAASAALQEAARLKGEAERAAATRDRAMAETQAATAKIEAREASRVLAERARMERESQRLVEQKSAEYAQLAAKKDQTFWGELSTPKKILYGVGLLLGAFGAIKTGRNTAAEMLTDAVDKWDAKRTADLTAARQAVENARTFKDQQVRAYLDNELKLAPLKKAAALESLADQVTTELSARKGQIDADAAAKAAEFAAKAKAEAAAIKADTARAFAPTASRSEIVQTPNAQKQAETTVTWAGKNFTARDVVTARKLNEKAASTDTMLQLYDKYEALVKQYEPNFFTTGEGRAKLGQVRGELTGAIKEQKALGALDNGVIRLADMIVPDSTSFGQMFKGGNKGVLDGIAQARQGAIRDMQNSLKTQGNQDVDVGPAQPAPAEGGGVRKIVNGKPAIVYPDGTYEPL